MHWQDGPAMILPHLHQFRWAARLVAAEALLLGRRNNTNEAFDWCEVALRMSQHVASEPTLIAQLVSYAIQTIALQPLKDYLSAAEVPPEGAVKFEEYLRQIDLYEGFHRAMIGERAFGLDSLDQLGEPFGKEAKIPQAAKSLFLVGYLEMMEKEIEINKLPYRLAKVQMDALEQQLKADIKYSLAAMMIPAYKHATQKRDWQVAEIGLCRVVLALKAYQCERHVYPKTLAELQQGLDWPLPQDPFSGKDFIYRCEGEGFILYSIGQDLEDDGGLPERDEQGKWRQDADIVWECVR